MKEGETKSEHGRSFRQVGRVERWLQIANEVSAFCGCIEFAYIAKRFTDCLEV